MNLIKQWLCHKKQQQSLIKTLKICEKKQMEINSIIKFYETQSPEAI
jgi:hypothetical protein